MAKVIAHIDLNAFFVRAEELKNPSLINKPVIVGGDGRSGIVSTCSYKAREYGIHSGMPTFKAKQLCRDVIIINGDYKYYEVLSIEFIQFIKQFADKVEQASVDECYADFTEAIKKEENPINFFLNLQKELYRKTGLKCSIGVSTTKFLAKMGSDLKKPMGLSIIKKKDIEKMLFSNPVSSYYGIGKQSAPKLEEHGIKTIGDLYYGIKNHDQFLENFYGKYQQDILNALEGKTSNELSSSFDDPQSISNRETLPYDINDETIAKSYLIECFENVYASFKKLRVMTSGITISYRYPDFTTKTFSKKLDAPTDDKLLLKDAISKHFDKTFNNKSIRQIGVVFERLSKRSESSTQMTLFNYEYYEDKDQTSEIINYFNKYIPNKNNKVFRMSKLLEKNDEDL